MGRSGAGDLGVRGQAPPVGESAREQVAGRDAGGGRRLGGADEGHQLPLHPARPPHRQARDGPRLGRLAHSILGSAYYILLRDEPYRELGADWLARRNDAAQTRRLVAQLERLGHTVVLDPVA